MHVIQPAKRNFDKSIPNQISQDKNFFKNMQSFSLFLSFLKNQKI